MEKGTARVRLTAAALEALGGELRTVGGADGPLMRIRLDLDGLGEDFIVPAGALEPVVPPVPDEPEPGAYEIEGRLVVRIPQTDGEYTNPDGDDWFVPSFAVAGDGRSWWHWGALWKMIGGPGVEIRRLVPEATPIGAVQLPWHEGGVYPPTLDYKGVDVDEAQSRDYAAHLRVGEGRVWLTAQASRAVAAALVKAADRNERGSA